MRLVYLDQVVGPNSTDIMRACCEDGIQVELYSGEIFEVISSLHPAVQWYKRARYSRSSFLRRLTTWSRFWARTSFELLFRKKPFDLFVVTNPPFNLFTALLLNRLRSVSYHVLVYDVYPDAIVQYGYLGQRNWLVRVWAWLMRQVMVKATSVITISESLKEALQKYNSTDRPIEVVPTWANNELVQPVPKTENPFLAELGLADKKVVLYSGNFGKTHDIRSLVLAARETVDRADVHWLLIGFGEQFAAIEELVSSLELPNLTLLSKVDRADFPQSVASGDVTIVTLEKAAESLSVPSKTYFAMAAGSAIMAVASEASELANTVARHEIGRRVEPGQPKELARVVVDMLDEKVELEAMQSRSREASFEYSTKNAERIVELIKRREKVPERNTK